jgi:hypothetical protein
VTAHPIIELRCDHPGCKSAVATGQRRVTDARAEATGAGGWATVTEECDGAPHGTPRVRRRDYCPDHATAALR